MSNLDKNKKLLRYLLAEKKFIYVEKPELEEIYLEVFPLIEGKIESKVAALGGGCLSRAASTDTIMTHLVKNGMSGKFEELKESLSRSNPNKKLSVYLNKLIIEKDYKAMEIVKKSYIEKSYFYQILRGTKNPSRNKLLQIILSMNLENDEIAKLLSIAGYGLSNEVKRDYIILFCIAKNLNTFETNNLLLAFDEVPLIPIPL